jgi:hypothetical protein
MFIKTKDDYSGILHTANHLEFSRLQPHFNAIQKSLIVNIFGLDFITALDTRYNTTNPNPALSAEELYLIDNLKTAIACLGFVKAIPQLLIVVMGTGMQQAGAKPVYEWQKLTVQDEILETGWNAVGSAIQYLWAKRNDSKFTAWKDSAAEKKSRQYLLNSASDFNNCFQIAYSTRTYEALKPSLKEANRIVNSVIGDALYNEIKTQNIGFNISSNNQYLLDNYIYDTLAQLTISIAIYKLELVYNEEGARVISQPASKTTQRAKSAASENTKKETATSFIESGNAYLSELAQYLAANVSTYPLYTPTLNSSTTNSAGGVCVL